MPWFVPVATLLGGYALSELSSRLKWKRERVDRQSDWRRDKKAATYVTLLGLCVREQLLSEARADHIWTEEDLQGRLPPKMSAGDWLQMTAEIKAYGSKKVEDLFGRFSDERLSYEIAVSMWKAVRAAAQAHGGTWTPDESADMKTHSDNAVSHMKRIQDLLNALQEQVRKELGSES